MAQITKKYQSQMKHIGSNGIVYNLYPRTLAYNTTVSIGTVGNETTKSLSSALKSIDTEFGRLVGADTTVAFISHVTYASTAETIYSSVVVPRANRASTATRATSAGRVSCDSNQNILITSYMNKTAHCPIQKSDDYTNNDSTQTTKTFITSKALNEIFSSYSTSLSNYYTTASKVTTAAYSDCAIRAIKYNDNGNVSPLNIDQSFFKKSEVVDITLNSSDKAGNSLIATKINNSFISSYASTAWISELSNGVGISENDFYGKGNIHEDLGLGNTLKFASVNLIPKIFNGSTVFNGNAYVYNASSVTTDKTYGFNGNYAVFEDGVSSGSNKLVNIINITEPDQDILPFEYERTVFFIVSVPISVLTSELGRGSHITAHDLSGMGAMVFMHPARSYDVHLITSTEINPPVGIDAGLSYNNIYIDNDSYKFSFLKSMIANSGGKYSLMGWNITALIV